MYIYIYIIYHEKLSQRWLDSNYPATHAALAMQIYCGARILEAEGEASRPIWTKNGILAGDPQAPLAAKIYLQEALHAFCKPTTSGEPLDR